MSFLEVVSYWLACLNGRQTTIPTQRQPKHQNINEASKRKRRKTGCMKMTVNNRWAWQLRFLFFPLPIKTLYFVAFLMQRCMYSRLESCWLGFYMGRLHYLCLLLKRERTEAIKFLCYLGRMFCWWCYFCDLHAVEVKPTNKQCWSTSLVWLVILCSTTQHIFR